MVKKYQRNYSNFQYNFMMKHEIILIYFDFNRLHEAWITISLVSCYFIFANDGRLCRISILDEESESD